MRGERQMREFHNSASNCLQSIRDIVALTMDRYVGCRVRIIKDFHDQPIGFSRPNLKGKLYTIKAVSADMDRVNVWLVGLQCAVSPEYLEIVGK